MAVELRVKDVDRLVEIINGIHDHWFSIEDVVHNARKRTFEIRFTRPAPKKAAPPWFRRIERPPVAAVLRVHRVVDCEIVDKEQVGLYDFNEITYSTEKRQVSITTGVPISIVISVEELEVSLEISDEAIVQRSGSEGVST